MKACVSPLSSDAGVFIGFVNGSAVAARRQPLRPAEYDQHVVPCFCLQLHTFRTLTQPHNHLSVVVGALGFPMRSINSSTAPQLSRSGLNQSASQLPSHASTPNTGTMHTPPSPSRYRSQRFSFSTPELWVQDKY